MSTLGLRFVVENQKNKQKDKQTNKQNKNKQEKSKVIKHNFNSLVAFFITYPIFLAHTYIGAHNNYAVNRCQ